jgi:hypothetical protein
VTGVEKMLAGDWPLEIDLWTCFTERGAERSARRWVRKIKRQRGWRGETRRVAP